MTVRQMLKPYIVVLADVMPNVTDGIAIVVHVVTLEFLLLC